MSAEIRPSRLRLLLIFSISLFLGLTFGLMALDQIQRAEFLFEYAPVLLVGGSFIFGLLALGFGLISVGMAILALRRAPMLAISEEGVELGFIAPSRIPWWDIDDVDLVVRGASRRIAVKLTVPHKGKYAIKPGFRWLPVRFGFCEERQLTLLAVFWYSIDWGDLREKLDSIRFSRCRPLPFGLQEKVRKGAVRKARIGWWPYLRSGAIVVFSMWIGITLTPQAWNETTFVCQIERQQLIEGLLTNPRIDRRFSKHGSYSVLTFQIEGRSNRFEVPDWNPAFERLIRSPIIRHWSPSSRPLVTVVVDKDQILLNEPDRHIFEIDVYALNYQGQDLVSFADTCPPQIYWMTTLPTLLPILVAWFYPVIGVLAAWVLLVRNRQKAETKAQDQT